MSAFLCSNRHTAVIAMLAHAPGIVDSAQLAETARILRALNDAALRARYGDKPNPLTRAEFSAALQDAAAWMRTANNADICSAVRCFDYQCAEDIPDDYPGRAILADILARVSALPNAGLNSAVWSI